VALMNDGHIVQTGIYQEIVEHPVNAWVADFVGV
jgi:ABC-type proline/glycine betaine transport system ATPase subunit